MDQGRIPDGADMKRKKIAIIGSGISGLTCGWSLAPHHDIVVYEASDYIGGHTHTVDVVKDGEHSRIDTGFIVFNDRTYPEFISLMNHLGVEYQPTEMSFSVRNDAIGLEYNGNSLTSLFAQRKNLISPRFWSMLADILTFNKAVRREAEKGRYTTLGEFLGSTSYGALFQENYLLPMVSAIWSMGVESCREFPLKFFVGFFDNHGLLNLINRPQWYTVTGGSSSYLEPLTKNFKNQIRSNCAVTSVKSFTDKVAVTSAAGTETFDEVIFACHGDEALEILEQTSTQQQKILSSFQFSTNRVVLHTDTSFLPRSRRAWASWNYNLVDAAREQSTLTYNMNILQRLQKQNTYLVTLNQEIDERHVLGTYHYSHPIYTRESIQAQQQWHTISGRDGIHFCGAYWFNGFHEDGVRSALRVCKSIEGES